MTRVGGRSWSFVAALAVALVVASPAASTGSDGSFVVGFTEDLPKQAGLDATAPMTALGAGAFRITTMWTPGQTAVTAEEATRIGRAVAAANGMRVVLAVYADAASKAPRDAAARDAYCSTVRDALRRFPTIRDVVVWNEPNKSLFWSPQTAADGSAVSPRDYEALLARCWDVLHAAFSNVNVVGLALSSTGNDNSGSTSPGNFIRLVGDAYRASGRTRPLMDTVGHHPYGLDATERPWRKHIASKVIAMGDWNKLMFNLYTAFNGTAQPIPGQAGMAIWYLELGFQTALDPGKEGAYTGTENALTLPDAGVGEPEAPPPAETTPAPDQATQVVDATRLAYCQPHVGTLFSFLLFDEPRLAGWQSGAYWADRSPKDSLSAFQSAIAEANGGAVACGSLKGGPPSADFLPPPTPTGVTAQPQASPPQVTVSWNAVADDASAVSYRVYRNGAHVATTTATTWTNISVQGGQTYSYAVRAIDSAGNLGDASPSVTVTVPLPPPSGSRGADFDGDRVTDFGLFRPTQSPDALWYAPQSGGGAFQIFFGAAGDVPVVGDYDGDGRTDAVIYRPSSGLWYGPRTGAPSIVIQLTLGQPGDVPVPADYDGDGKTDPAIYRPATGMFFAVLSAGGTRTLTFGAPTDIPFAGDFDGDRRAEFGIFRPSVGLWYAPLTGGGAYQIFFGATGDVPVVGDYDGDGRAEAALFRPATGLWHAPLSAGGLYQRSLGQDGDVPIPGFYDADAAADVAIFRPSTGLWFASLSVGGTRRIDGLGLASDVPVQRRPTLDAGR